MQVFRLAMSIVVGIVLPLVVQLLDKRRLSEEQRVRSWNFATWGSALYAFGPLSMLGWMWVTRPRWLRCAYGAAWTGALTLAMAIIDHLFQSAVGLAAEDTPADLLIAVAAISAGCALLLLIMEAVVSLVLAWRRR